MSDRLLGSESGAQGQMRTEDVNLVVVGDVQIMGMGQIVQEHKKRGLGMEG